MLLSFFGCHGIQCLKLCNINEKKRFGKIFCSSFFTSKQIDLPKKNKGGQKLYDVNVRAIYGCRQVGADPFKKTLLLLEYA